MADDARVKKIRDKIASDESRLNAQISEMERLWEDTGLDPKDPSYLVEKTMRFEMAQENINRVVLLFRETIDGYRRLCDELERSDDSR